LIIFSALLPIAIAITSGGARDFALRSTNVAGTAGTIGILCACDEIITSEFVAGYRASDIAALVTSAERLLENGTRLVLGAAGGAVCGASRCRFPLVCDAILIFEVDDAVARVGVVSIEASGAVFAAVPLFVVTLASAAAGDADAVAAAFFSAVGRDGAAVECHGAIVRAAGAAVAAVLKALLSGLTQIVAAHTFRAHLIDAVSCALADASPIFHRRFQSDLNVLRRH
jgi:hypothetical protein